MEYGFEDYDWLFFYCGDMWFFELGMLIGVNVFGVVEIGSFKLIFYEVFY